MSFRRSGPKRASQTEQKKLVNNAKKLAENPSKVIPECRDNCFLCKYRSDEKKIKKIAKYKDNEERLDKYSKRGPDLAKAVAGTLLLAIQEKAPLLARAQTPQGQISFAKRGNADKERLIGIQHFQDPTLRLLAYSKEAKKGYYFYSWKDNIVCTGKNDKPPEEFVKDTLLSLPYNLKKSKNKVFCKGISKKKENSYFILNWKPTDYELYIDTNCAKREVNLFASLSSNMMSSDNSRSFELDAEYKLKCESDCKTCRFDVDVPLSDELKEKYFQGQLSDITLLDKYEKDGWSVIKKESSIYAIGDRCYGNNMGDFLSTFRFEDWEEPALRKIVERANGIVLEEGTVNELLKDSWDDMGVEAINEIIDDEELSKKIFDEYKDKSKLPREILREALNRKKRREKLSSLPEFKNLPPKAKFANEAAKIYKTEGKDEVLKYIENQELGNTRMKSLAYGFLKALGEGQSSKWKYEDSEIESGEFMSEYVQKLLNAEGEEYAQSLKTLLKMSGSTASIITEDGREI